MEVKPENLTTFDNSFSGLIEAIQCIFEHPYDSIHKNLDVILEQVIAITESKIGYIYYYDEATEEFRLHDWSKLTMQNCFVPNPPTHYELNKTGIWGEVVRQRKPIVLNDFQKHHPLKKGLPEGHAELLRYLSIPVIINERVVAAVGVANKESDYTEKDVAVLTLLMDSAWRYVEKIDLEKTPTQSEKKLMEFIHSGIEPIFIVSLETSPRFVDVNRIFEKYSGYTREEVVGKKLTEITFVSEWVIRNILSNRHLQTDTPAEIVLQLSKKDQTPLHVNATVAFMNLFDDEYAIFRLSDLTEKIRAEEIAMEAESKYLSLFQHMNQAFAVHRIILDAEGKPIDYIYLDVNRCFEELTGLKKEEIVGRRVLDILPKTEPYWIDAFGEVAISGIPTQITRYSVSFEKYFEVSAYSHSYEYFACLFTDITQKVHTEHLVNKYQRNLKMLNSQLIFTEEKVRKKVAQELHDHVSQPLALARITVGSIAKSIADENIKKELSASQEYISKAIKDSRRLTAEIYPPALHEMGIEAAIQEHLEMIKLNHAINTVYTCTTHRLPANKERQSLLFRLFTELCHNVLKHAKATTIKVYIREHKEFVQLIVADDGVGIKHTKETDPYSGFGLFSIRERLGLINGTIEISSAINRGTEVILSFPL